MDEISICKCDATMPVTLSALDNGSLIIPAEFVERWRGQMKTPYSELSESEQDSDGIEADKFIELFGELYNHTDDLI